MRFLVLKIAFSVAFIADIASSVTSTDPVTTPVPVPIPVYYDCGSRIFFENLIQDVIRLNVVKNNVFEIPFQELLYDLEPNYRKLPIPAGYGLIHSTNAHKSNSVFYIIIDQMSRLVDVVTEMKNNHFIKCKRIDESVPEPSQDDPNLKYNYKCGHDLFSHEVIQFSVKTAVSNPTTNKVYPAPYRGNLYNLDLGYWIYPVLRVNKGLTVSLVPENTYFVVFSAAGELIDVIAELKDKDFIKCTKTTEESNISLNGNLISGYMCAFEFFDINYMKRTAGLALARYKWDMSRAYYPKIYNGPPFHEDHWIYPILPNGIFSGGVSHQHSDLFLVMNTAFEIEFAAAKTAEAIHPCEATMRSLEFASPETGDFNCGDTRFHNARLQQLVQSACEALENRPRRFPGKYQGPRFDIQGPYVTWPLGQGIQLTGRPGNYRIVMNIDCKLAGVIAKTNDGFYKCRRSTDGSIPGEVSTELIREILSESNRDLVNFRKRLKSKKLSAKARD